MPKVLLVDDNEGVLKSLGMVLEHNNFEVVTARNVNEALVQIASAKFDVLLSDLHMPDKGDGLTVVSAMRHANPDTLTLVFSGFPEMNEAMTAILLQADEVLVKPLRPEALVKLIHDRLAERIANRSAARASVIASVATILEEDATQTIENWLAKLEDEEGELTLIPLTSQQRTAHLPALFRDLVARLRKPENLNGRRLASPEALEHGRVRQRQGYSPDMMVEESRMLQVSIFQTLQNNLSRVDFSLVLVDVMSIADEVDWQLTQAIRGYMEEMAVKATPIDAALTPSFKAQTV